VPYLTVAQVGTTVRFTNKDGYDHHVRSTPTGPLGSTPPAKGFELRLDAAPTAAGNNDPYGGTPAPRKAGGTSSADVKMDQAGAIGLGCHIHGSMRGQLFVADSPWFGKTDANGIATLPDVPDGPAQISLWHPDQLQDQPAVPVVVEGAPLKAAAQLNFVPRRRRS
jgi:plastocyanin